MKKYKVHLLNYVIYLLGILLFFWLFNIVDEKVGKVLFVISILSLILAIINAIYVKCVVNEDGITLRTLIFTKYFKWKDIEAIYRQPAGLVRVSVVVYAKSGKMIVITPEIANYKELLRIVVDNSKKHNENVSIDQRVYQLFNE